MISQRSRANWSPQTDEVTLFDYWQVISKRKWGIIALCAVMTMGTLVVSFLLPKIYESTATLLPQLESNNGVGLGARDLTIGRHDRSTLVGASR